MQDNATCKIQYEPAQKLSPEQIEQLQKICQQFVAAVRSACEVIKQWYKIFAKAVRIAVGIYYNRPGYKRLRKRAALIYYQRISASKTNNWRRMHGLPAIRRI